MAVCAKACGFMRRKPFTDLISRATFAVTDDQKIYEEFKVRFTNTQ